MVSRFCCVVAMAASAFFAGSAQATASPLESETHTAISHCLQQIDPGAVVKTGCPELANLLAGSSSPVLDSLKETSVITAEDLEKFQSAVNSIQSDGVNHWGTDSGALADVMSDYDFAGYDEELAASDRFWNWLKEKLTGSRPSGGLGKIGEAMTMSAEARDRLKKFAWLMAGLIVISALVMLVYTLWRYIDPVQSQGRNQGFNSRLDTGVGRGGLPVMTLEKIRELPANQQPAALLVAAVDRMRGKHLPRDPWAWTNAEIATAVSGKARGLLDPLNVLINNAERTLYGGMQARPEDISASFAAASTVIDAATPTSVDGGK